MHTKSGVNQGMSADQRPPFWGFHSPKSIWKKQVLNPQKGVSGTHTKPLFEKWNRFDRWTTEFDFGFGIRTTVLNIGMGSRTTAFIFGLDSLTKILNFGFGSRTTSLNFRLGSRNTEFNSGFDSQTTVINFRLESRTIAVTSWRSESSYINLVVFDKLLYVLSKPLFWKIRKSTSGGWAEPHSVF